MVASAPAVSLTVFDRVLVEPGHSGEPAGDGGPGPAAGFEFSGEAFDAGAADGEQDQGAGAAPDGELAEAQCVRLAGQAAVPGQEPGEGKPFGAGKGTASGSLPGRASGVPCARRP
jgi:hypothetical protein